jgi:hypothetical protein
LETNSVVFPAISGMDWMSFHSRHTSESATRIEFR